MKQIQSLFCWFLLNGHKPEVIKAKIAWWICTLQKDEGDLGFKDVREWNKGLILKHLISLANPNLTSLWADWLHRTVIKDSSLWIISKPRKCSWILWKLLEVCTSAMHHISYIIGNGHHTSLWFYPWYNSTQVCLSSNTPIISHSGLPKYAKVCSILSSTAWSLPGFNFHDMYVWREQFRHSTPFNLNERDEISCDNISMKADKVTDLWQAVLQVGIQVRWASSVWHGIGVPKYLFFTG